MPQYWLRHRPYVSSENIPLTQQLIRLQQFADNLLREMLLNFLPSSSPARTIVDPRKACTDEHQALEIQLVLVSLSHRSVSVTCASEPIQKAWHPKSTGSDCRDNSVVEPNHPALGQRTRLSKGTCRLRRRL